MSIQDIEYIKTSIRNHLADLHILFVHDQVNIDISYYNDVNMVLLAAEDGLKKATRDHEQRLKDHLEKYGNPNNIVD